MQRRQAWIREDRVEIEAEPLDLVASASLKDDPEGVGSATPLPKNEYQELDNAGHRRNPLPRTLAQG